MVEKLVIGDVILFIDSQVVDITFWMFKEDTVGKHLATPGVVELVDIISLVDLEIVQSEVPIGKKLPLDWIKVIKVCSY